MPLQIRITVPTNPSGILFIGTWVSIQPINISINSPILWIISKSYFSKINAHMANFLVSQSDPIRNFKGWLLVINVNGLP